MVIMWKFFIIVIPCIIFANNDIVAQEKELTLNEKISINNLKDHVMHKRKGAVAKQIKYPLERCDYFDLYINDENDFVDSFDQIFDSIQIEEFKTQNWGYRFIPTVECYLLQGAGYFGMFDNDGILNLTHIPLSQSEINLIQKFVENEKNCLHPSIRNYSEPVCLLLAGKYRIRIDLMKDGKIRYSSWKKDAAASAIPDLVIYDGHRWGNRWGTNYEFKNGEYEYCLSDYFVGDGPCFYVRKNGEIIMEITPDDIQIKRFSKSWSIAFDQL